MDATERDELADIARRRAAGEIDAREAAAERAFVREHHRALRQHGHDFYADDSDY
jgi:hypothetical protein